MPDPTFPPPDFTIENEPPSAELRAAADPQAAWQHAAGIGADTQAPGWTPPVGMPARPGWFDGAEPKPTPALPSPADDPMRALRHAATIGASRPGERYLEPERWSLRELVGYVLSGSVGAPASATTMAFEPAMGPGEVEAALAKRLPRFAKALEQYTSVTELPSRLEAAVAKLPKTVQPGQLQSIVPKGLASGEEFAWRGGPQLLEQMGGKPVARETIQETFAGKPLQVQVKTLGAGTGEKPPPLSIVQSTNPRSGHYNIVEPDGRVVARAESLEQAQIELADWTEHRASNPNWNGAPTKFSQYQVPGGTNYRETLITLPPPERDFSALNTRQKAIEGELKALSERIDREGHGGTDQTWAELYKLQDEHAALSQQMSKDPPNLFHSSHFDEPNILVHTRSNERTLPTGEGVHYTEEIQSDLHQTGAKEGYKQPIPPESNLTWNQFAAQQGMSREESGRVFNTHDPRFLEWFEPHQNAVDVAFKNEHKVPDFPFKDSWVDLGLKQELLQAAANPKVEVYALSTADTQIKRYGTERLTWKPTGDGGFHVRFEPQVGGDALGGDLGAQALERGLIENKTRVIRSEKDLAEMMSGSDVKAAKGWKRIQSNPGGGEYQPRAEGMRQKYDEEARRKLEKLVKPFGGTVERAPINAGTMADTSTPRELGAAFFDALLPTQGIDGRVPVGPIRSLFTRQQMADQFANGQLKAFDFPPAVRAMVEQQTTKAPAWIVRLTPEMKAKILKTGFPLLAAAGMVAQDDDPR